jgi:hypothetical protein
MIVSPTIIIIIMMYNNNNNYNKGSRSSSSSSNSRLHRHSKIRAHPLFCVNQPKFKELDYLGEGQFKKEKKSSLYTSSLDVKTK